MSYYDDDRSRRPRSTRERSRRDDYYDGTVYDQDVRDTRIVKRRDDSSSSVEEVSRDFAPGDRGAALYRETTVRRSGHRPIRARSTDDRWYDDRFDDRSYTSRRRRGDDDDDTYVSKRTSRKYDDRRRSRRRDSDSDYSSRSRSRTPPRRERRKSTTEEVLGSLGLGGVAAAVLGKNRDRARSRSVSSDRVSRRRSRSRAGSRRSSSDRSGRRNKSKVRSEQVSQAIKAAVLAGASEAFRARKEPGGWGGEKGKRVLTAALAAGGVDGLISDKRDPDHHAKRDIVGSAIAGLAANRVINGPRSKSRGRTGSPDSRRGRSQSRGGLGDLAAGGVVAATAKKVYDHVRSRSRGRARSRDSSYDSGDSPSPPRRKRSQSVSGLAAKGLAALGFKDTADKVDPERRRSRSRTRRYSDDDDYYDGGRNGGYGYGYSDSRDVSTFQPQHNGHFPSGSRSMSLPRGSVPGYELDYGPRHTGDPETDSDSDLGSSSDDEKQQKKSRKKALLTGGLATVATIHAAHNVWESMEKREARRKALREGEISPEKARVEKNKARLQDAASIGIAALGLKGAYGEWKEVLEHHKQMQEDKEKKARHRAKREARRRKLAMLAAQQHHADGGVFSGSMPNLPTATYDPYRPHSIDPYGGYHATGPPYTGGPYSHEPPIHYSDDNPYTAVSHQPQYVPANYVPSPPPPPPMGGPQPPPPPPNGVPRTDTH
ncbi:hypothetical protein HRR83_006551 [Exophiala dermatitidis]|uniref:Uncharacterized protein n=1 Tax=Exophiala dermatitidis TaxID=5970 RepID=A0AAN6ESD1_EXODE|nr:hypothetical protein HRR75_005236 [Exophiala dermatitidis]KAJ4514053.1 hypothetical protein HRR74_005711 [Exophiala dermatitidis]KAJ4515464.1 hypothetical protein HRR73_005296 [Exophiala dermatitidis]KAJ4536478.1 hypothetical protein HRR77_007395 [Exophiala dermatitidis]KAJ4540993.1 hypothetical protein HRR76_004375 [Exophiala dermatitidis]